MVNLNELVKFWLYTGAIKITALGIVGFLHML